MNRILLSIAISLVTFAVALWFFFPYEIFTDRILSTVGQNTGSPIKYDSVTTGIMSTNYAGVKAGDREIGEVSFSHSPMKIMRGQLGVTVDGIYKTTGTLSASRVDFDMTTVGRALDFIQEPVRLEGNVHVYGTVDMAQDSSDITAEVDKMVMSSPIGEMDFKKVTADVQAKNRTLDVLSLKSEDKNGLDLSGTVHLDRYFFAKSPVSLAGNINMMGQKKHISIRGTFKNLHPIID